LDKRPNNITGSGGVAEVMVWYFPHRVQRI